MVALSLEVLLSTENLDRRMKGRCYYTLFKRIRLVRRGKKRNGGGGSVARAKTKRPTESERTEKKPSREPSMGRGELS